jgi:hypothetical protein
VRVNGFAYVSGRVTAIRLPVTSRRNWMNLPRSKEVVVGFMVCRPSGTKDALTVFDPDPRTAGRLKEAVAVKLTGWAKAPTVSRKIPINVRRGMPLPW